MCWRDDVKPILRDMYGTDDFEEAYAIAYANGTVIPEAAHV